MDEYLPDERPEEDAEAEEIDAGADEVIEYSDAPRPWDRIRNPPEPRRWFCRFDLYRRLGQKRTIIAAYCKFLGRQKPHASPEWLRQAARWRWRERAEAWDEEQLRKERLAEEMLLAERRKAWAIQAMEMQEAGFLAIKRKAQAALDGNGDISMRDATTLVEVGQKLERLARGEATEHTRTEHSGKIDWDILVGKRPDVIDPIESRISALEKMRSPETTLPALPAPQEVNPQGTTPDAPVREDRPD